MNKRYARIFSIISLFSALILGLITIAYSVYLSYEIQFIFLLIAFCFLALSYLWMKLS